jgi:enoyl-CoA hydratase/carnithine racemase
MTDQMSYNGDAAQPETGAQLLSQRRGQIAVIVLRSAPDNALSPGVCRALGAQIGQALADSAVQGIVIASDLQMFSLGQDARGRFQDHSDTALDDLCAQIAGAQKPVVAAIAGECLGAGLSLALACRARIGAPQTICTFDDTDYAALPRGAGAVRLAQLIPAQGALDMLLNGEKIGHDAALSLGLLDDLAPSSAQALVLACDWATALAQGTAQAQRRIPFEHARTDLADIARARATRPRGAVVDAILTAVESVYLLPSAIALQAGEAAAKQLRADPVARALAYANHAFTSRNAQDQGVDAAKITLDLRRKMGQVVAHFEASGTPRPDILGAIAAYGVAIPKGATPPRCPSGAEDVMPAVLAALANLGAQMLREGAIENGAQMDGALLAANMFPRAKGGPMYQADLRGALVMRAELVRRSGQKGDHVFAPDPMWDEIISRGRGLI